MVLRRNTRAQPGERVRTPPRANGGVSSSTRLGIVILLRSRCESLPSVCDQPPGGRHQCSEPEDECRPTHDQAEHGVGAIVARSKVDRADDAPDRHQHDDRAEDQKELAGSSLADSSAICRPVLLVHRDTLRLPGRDTRLARTGARPVENVRPAAIQQSVRTPPPPSDGVLWPDGLLTNPIGRSAARPSRSSAAESSRAPRRRDVLIVRLRACRLDREDRGKEAKDQEHRDRDRDSDPSDGEGKLARGCVHAGETPTRLFLFRDSDRFLWESCPGWGGTVGWS